jgi:peptidoglycan/LPS O-acetylase OafA/YrhL
MQRKNVLAVILILIIMYIIRTVGIEDIPFSIIIIILILCAIGMFFSAFRFKGDKTERKYLLIMTILMTVLFSISMMVISIQNNYLQVLEKYKSVFKTLMVILFIALFIVALANLIYKYKRDNKFKDK